MVFQDRAQPAREHLDLLGPDERAVDLAVDLGQHAVHDKVAELPLAAHVAVQRAGDHAKPGGEDAHAQGVHAVRADDGERLGDDPLAGERAAVPVIAVGRAEPQHVRLENRIRLRCSWSACPAGPAGSSPVSALGAALAGDDR
jgi:hypothetical protein